MGRRQRGSGRGARWPSAVATLSIAGLVASAGPLPTVVSAFVLGSAVLVSQAAGQDAGEAIPYFIADGAGVPGYQPSDSELARAAFEAWARESAGRLRFVEAGEADALIHLIWIAPGSGLYGKCVASSSTTGPGPSCT